MLSPESDGGFDITVDDLGKICNFDRRSEPSLLQELADMGGIKAVAKRLHTDLHNGLSAKKPGEHGSGRRPSLMGVTRSNTMMKKVDGEDLTRRTATFGENIIPPPHSDTILEIIVGTVVEDPILKILILGAIVVLTTGTILCPASGWTEGLAICIAVIIVLSVTAGNDWSKDRKFKKLLLLQTDKKCRVMRNGRKVELSSWDLLVGDVVELIVGDEVAADGLFISGNRLVVDESPLTGETQPQKKSESSPFMFSGCQVTEGTGMMLVTGVGINSSGGKIQELLNEAQTNETVLQAKLKDVAIYIGKIGIGAGAMTLIGLVIRWGITWANGDPTTGGSCGNSVGGVDATSRIFSLAQDIVVAITVIVVAVPEGLPLAVTLSLSLSMFKMIKDKCFVRHLDASETMGQATTICTDKTGTLTYNRMSVVRIMTGSHIYRGEGSGDKDALPFHSDTLPIAVKTVLTEAVCVNSNCFIKNEEKLDHKNVQPVFVGSATEGSLLMLSRKLGVGYRAVRERLKVVDSGVWSFSAEKKRMSTMVETKDGYRLYTKGASEVIAALCTHYMDPLTNQPIPIHHEQADKINDAIKSWASDGLRTLAIAYKDTKVPFVAKNDDTEEDPAKDLTFIALVAIKDPIRREIPAAVAACQKAGLIVRMVTGDNILTATKIAKECGIYHGDGVAIEGPVFRALSTEEKELIVPKIQVMARCSPNDKYELVSILRAQGEVVAVTGDGTNDAPALKEADVGFSMGLCGTQIAMNASDIILLDDNFASIVQSIRWGRNVLNGIRKFIQFQLGINLASILIVFVGSVVFGESPFTTVQLLWINLIMDSFGALGLASEEPDADILDYPPQRRSDPILTPIMNEYIFLQTVYQTALCLGIVFALDTWWPADLAVHKPSSNDLSGYPSPRAKTVLFTSFIFMQMANMACARQLNSELSIFGGIFRNRLFLLMIFLIGLIQVVVVIWGTTFIGTTVMSADEWILCICIGFSQFPVVFIFRILANLVRMARADRKSRRVDIEAPMKPAENDIVTVNQARLAADSKRGSLASLRNGGDIEGRRKSVVEKIRKIRVDAPMPAKSNGSLNRV